MAGTITGRWPRSGLGRTGRQVLGVALAIGGWQLYAAGPGARIGLPTPVSVAQRIGELVPVGEYWSAIGATLLLTGAGLGLSMLIGIPLGMLNGSWRRATLSSQFLVDFARTIPPIAVVPLMLLIWGGTSTMAIILIVFGAVWPILVQSTYAVQQVSPDLKRVSAAFHLSRVDQVRAVYLPSVLPFVITGLRVAATLSLLLAVVAGFFGGVPGIGQELFSSLDAGDSRELFVYATTAGVLGILINAAVAVVQRKVLWWHPSVRGEQR